LYLSNTAGEQAVAHAGRIEAGLVLLAHPTGMMLALTEVGIDIGLVPEIVAYDRVHVRQLERRVLLHDLFRGRPLAKGSDNCIEGDARRTHAHHAIRIGR
jgi:hypothetical protein